MLATNIKAADAAASSTDDKQQKWQHAAEVVGTQTDSESAYRAAMAAYEAGRYHEAFALTSELFKQMPDSEELNFALGASAYAIGKLSHAAVAFQRVVDLNPENQRAKLELARTYTAMGQFTLARETFRQVLESSPPAPVQENIDRYLEQIAQAQKQWKIGINVGAGVFYDDNVNVGPRESSVRIQPISFGPIRFDQLNVGQDSRPRDTFGVFGLVNGQVEFDPGFRGRWALTGSATYYGTLLESEDDDFDITFLRGTAGARYSSYRHLADIRGKAEYVEQGDDKLISTYGAEGGFACAVTEKDRWTTTGTAEYRNYAGVSDTDSVYGELGETYTRVIPDHQASVSFTVSGFYEDADADAFDNGGLRLGLAGRKALPWSLQGAASAGYRYSNYEGREVLAPEAREDHEWRLQASLNRPVTDQANTSLSYSYTFNDSNFGLYEYERNLLTLSMDYSF